MTRGGGDSARGLATSFWRSAPCCAAALLVACSSLSTISSPNPGTTFELEDKTLALPASTRVGRTTFGHFAFRATDASNPDAPPCYGILPLAVRKGQLAAGIVLTAPVMLLTKLRGAFKFYRVDARACTIGYRNALQDPWIEYLVKPGRPHARASGSGSRMPRRRRKPRNRQRSGKGTRRKSEVRADRWRQCPPAAPPPPIFAANGGFATHTNRITTRKMMPSRWKISLKPICAAWLPMM